MHKLIKKDYNKRTFIFKEEKKKLLIKFILYIIKINKKLKNKIFYKSFISNNNNNYYKSQIKNRCIFTARSRSVLSNYKLSRLTFRLLASNGLLNGIQKSS